MTRPFRLGATSCVYPDTIIENVRRLGPFVDDVELVLFDVAGYGCNFPAADEAAELARLAEEHALTYTVHLPRDVRTGNESLDLAKRAIDATAVLNPFAVILHFDGEAVLGEPSPETVAAWQDDAAAALDLVTQWAGGATRVCVENLERWSPHYFDTVAARAGVCRCVDIGHLWLEKVDPLPYLNAHLPATRVIHLHGVGERDHSSLALQPAQDVAAVVRQLARSGYRDVVTLEVFSTDDFFSSVQALDTALNSPVTR